MKLLISKPAFAAGLMAIYALISQASAQETPPAPAKPAAPQRLDGTVPDYPEIARRYNVHGPVLVKLTVGKDGRVKETEIAESPADVLSDAVRQAVRDWTFTKPEEQAIVTMRIPFVLTGDEYAFDTALRPLQFAPKDKKDVKKKITEGWQEVRLLIDKAGAVSGSLVLKSSGKDFRAAGEAIIAALKFAPVAEGTPAEKSTTVNLFTIRVTDSQIEVEQHAGD